MRRRIIPALLCLVLFLNLFSLPALAVGEKLAYATEQAGELKALGLFQGISENNFDLSRAPTRTEALVMLVRLLGKEAEALSGEYSHPFLDVPAWADAYVGYAYEQKLVNGVSAHHFGTGAAGADVYLTFVLRALGYSDRKNADFSWDDPYSLAGSIGLLPEGINTSRFLRADVAIVSHSALICKLKDAEQTLAAKLISEGAFTQEAFSKAYHEAGPVPEDEPLSSREIYAACAPGVFSIMTYDKDDEVYAQGSGFFIDSSGIAVTNQHVLEDALRAEAELSDGTTVKILGVIYDDVKSDYAVIRVEGSGYTALPLGDSEALAGGEKVYAIGNPRGMSNTISDGLVSNPRISNPQIGIRDYIQITTPISHGSSGGALINEMGEVVGITTASISSGQNLNFAVPIQAVIRDGKIADYPKQYGVQSFHDYAMSRGYILNEARRAEAFAAVRSFLSGQQGYAGQPYSIRKVVEEDGYDGYYQVALTQGGAVIELMFYFHDTDDGSVYTGTVEIHADREDVLTRYSCRIGSYGRWSYRNGSAWFPPMYIYPEAEYTFTSYDGNDRTRDAYIALALYEDALEGLDYLLKEVMDPAGEYTIFDFGFSRYTPISEREESEE